jgi:hypothetical protein
MRKLFGLWRKPERPQAPGNANVRTLVELIPVPRKR